MEKCTKSKVIRTAALLCAFIFSFFCLFIIQPKKAEAKEYVKEPNKAVVNTPSDSTLTFDYHANLIVLDQNGNTLFSPSSTYTFSFNYANYFQLTSYFKLNSLTINNYGGFVTNAGTFNNIDIVYQWRNGGINSLPINQNTAFTVYRPTASYSSVYGDFQAISSGFDYFTQLQYDSYGKPYVVSGSDQTLAAQQYSVLANYASTPYKYYLGIRGYRSFTAGTNLGASNISRITVSYYPSEQVSYYTETNVTKLAWISYLRFTIYDTSGGFIYYDIPSFAGSRSWTEDVFIAPNYEVDTESVSYQAGYDEGYQQGLLVDQDNIYDEGYSAGKNIGYNEGYSAGLADTNTLVSVFSAAVQAPVDVFVNMLDFEVLGVNLSRFALGLFTLCVLLTVVRLFV